MFCQNCNKKEAVYHATTILNGVEESCHLCEECAVQAGKMRSTDEIFKTFFKSFNDFFEQDVFDNLFCPTCNNSLTDFRNHNFLGCEDCFDFFKTDLNALTNIGRKNDKIEFRTPQKSPDEEKLEELKLSLQKAIKDERYEDASDINKQIKKLQQKILGNE